MRLLLAEDEIELTSAFEVIFKHNNYTIDVVYNGLDAVEYATVNQYDYVVMIGSEEYTVTLTAVTTTVGTASNPWGGGGQGGPGGGRPGGPR